jgi:hypothetical protein
MAGDENTDHILFIYITAYSNAIHEGIEMIEKNGKLIKRVKKVRSDKGEIRVTKRDLGCIAWIAHQYAARGDQIQLLLTRYPDPQHPFQEDVASESTTREQISRWVRAGWVVYKRVLANGPGWAFVTRAGLHLVGLDQVYVARPPSPKRLEHIFAVNQVRLWMDEEHQYPWMSERLYKASLNLKRGESSGPIPDAILQLDSGKVALEIQLSYLKPHEWLEKLSELMRHTVSTGLRYERAFPEVWVYVPTETMKKAGDEARVKLDDPDRVEIIVEDDLLIEDAENSWS